MTISKQVITLLVVSVSYCMSGQKVNNTTQKDSSNIYYDAVRRHAEDLNTGNKRTLFLSNENDHLDYFPEQVGLVDIKAVNLYSREIKKIIRKKKRYEVIKVSGLNVSPSGSFYISLIYFDVALKGRSHYYFINKGGVKIKYTYDDEKKEFIFESIEG